MKLTMAVIASTLSIVILAIGFVLWVKFWYADPYGVAIVIALYFSISAVVGIVVVGVPIHFIFSRHGINSFAPYAFVGVLIPCTIVFLFKPFGNSQLQQLVIESLFSGFIGAICAIVFWAVAVKCWPNPSFKRDTLKRAP